MTKVNEYKYFNKGKEKRQLID